MEQFELLNAPPTLASRTACRAIQSHIIPTERQYYYIGVNVDMYILALFVATTAATYYYNREQDRRRAYYREKIKELKRV